MAKLKCLVLLFCLPLDVVAPMVAPNLLDFGCLGEYEDVSEGEDPCDDGTERPAAAAGRAPASLLFLCGVSVQKFCEQNSTLHGLLGLACAKCVEACQIHDQFLDTCDGIGAFCTLEAHALGQAIGESVEGILTRLLGMQPTDDLKVMLEYMPLFSIVCKTSLQLPLTWCSRFCCFIFFMTTLCTLTLGYKTWGGTV